MMRFGAHIYSLVVGAVYISPSLIIHCTATAFSVVWAQNSKSLNVKRHPGPLPAPEEGPRLSANAVRDPVYLPAQIGGIVGAYAISLVLVALTLLALFRRRRDRLRNFGNDSEQARVQSAFNPFPQPFLLQSEEDKRAIRQDFPYPLESPTSPSGGFSLPANSPSNPGRLTPLRSAESWFSSHPELSPVSSVSVPGYDPAVDQTVAARDRAMAQTQLEEMYKYVMEQEEAKAEGRVYEPDLSLFTSSWPNTPMAPALPKKKFKPSKLKLVKEEKTQSRGAAILSFLKTPRRSKAPPRGLEISAPIMTPTSSTFPRREEQEMYIISPRQYTPAVPPPVPGEVLPFRRQESHLPTPVLSPNRVQSIGKFMDNAMAAPSRQEAIAEVGRERERDGDVCACRCASHQRNQSAESSDETEPFSAVSQRFSASALVGLPMTPKPGINRFPSLDALPTRQTLRPPSLPGINRFPSMNTFPSQQTSRPPPMPPNISVVRPDGALPLRAYEPSLPSATGFSHTKKTVFTRAGPQSPGIPTGMQSPWTGVPVPYTPYQPFSPVVPITPSLLTRKERKRLKKLEVKSPTAEMVEDEDDMWG